MEAAWSRKSPLASDSKLGHCRQFSVGVPCKSLYLPCNHPAINNKAHQSVSPSIVGADSSLHWVHSQNTADYRGAILRAQESQPIIQTLPLAKYSPFPFPSLSSPPQALQIPYPPTSPAHFSLRPSASATLSSTLTILVNCDVP
jgi:hypothetical protein